MNVRVVEGAVRPIVECGSPIERVADALDVVSVHEARNGRQFRVFSDRAAALAWLESR